MICLQTFAYLTVKQIGCIVLSSCQNIFNKYMDQTLNQETILDRGTPCLKFCLCLFDEIIFTAFMKKDIATVMYF